VSAAASATAEPASIRLRVYTVALTLGAALALSIPVMAAYGLKVCPVLLPLGFGFGCQYLLLFAANLAILNALFLRRLTRALTGKSGAIAASDLQAAPRRSAWAYLLAYGVTVAELLAVLTLKQVSLESRGPEILAIVALLLATLQYYGTAWAILPASGAIAVAPPPAAPRRIWTRGALRVAIPALISAAIGAHFMLRSASLAHVLTPGAAMPDDPLNMIALLAFLLAWQVAVMGFYAAAEVDFGQRASRHLQAVTNLDFTHRSHLFGWGYWTELFRAMNTLSQGLLERSRLLKGFSTFVSHRVVEDVLKQEVQFGGKREELTVLMTDLRDFTKLSESLKPEDVVRMLNLYFYAMIEELGKEGVTVDKFIGDGLLAYVDTDGPRTTPTDECARATRAALAMYHRLDQVNGQLSPLGLPQLRIGIGIARGVLVRGNIGGHERMQYTVIGDTVNLAARLEGLCKDLDSTIVIDHPVWNVLPPILQSKFREQGLKAVKGRTEQVRVYAH
jgi:class 3 adenylate cyclase